MSENACEHRDFTAVVKIARFKDRPECQADVRINCAKCQKPFRFLGLPSGLDFRGACVSLDGLEARLAIVDKDKTLEQFAGVAGFTIARRNAR